MHMSTATRQFTKQGKWSHIGKRSINGGIFPVFKRAMKRESNIAQRRGAGREIEAQLMEDQAQRAANRLEALLAWWELEGDPDEFFDEQYEPEDAWYCDDEDPYGPW